MSEFIAEAQVLVKPDTTRFRAQLEKQLLAATKGVVIPISVVPAKGAAGAATGLTALTAAAGSATVAETELAGAEVAAARAAKIQTGQTKQLNAALLGLRTAIGSSAVIGLGALSLGAIAAGTALRQMLIDTAAFEQELATLGAVTEATAAELDAASEAALRLGADVRLPAVSAADAAVAMTELAKAGLSVEEAIAGAEGVLQLATAAQISFGDAAQITANALNSFGLSGDRAVVVADRLANAANASQGSISDMALALRQASAVAEQVGINMKDTVTILSLFAKNGLQGSDAGTSLRVALIKLIAPTKAAREEIARLHLVLRDVNGNVRPDILAQFGQATRDLSPAARDAAAALIFGQDAIRAVSIGAREGREGLKQMRFEIDQTGTAAEVAAARNEGLAGAFGALKSNAQTLGIEIGLIASGPLQEVLDTVNENITVLTKFADQLRKLANIKIPPITIPLKFTSFDTPGGTVGELITRAITETSKTVLQGGIIPRLAIKGVRELTEGSKEAEKSLKQLQGRLQDLQSARTQAGELGLFSLAARLTKEINGTRDEINKLKKDMEEVPKSIGGLQQLADTLQKVKDSFPKGADTSSIDIAIGKVNKALRELGPNATAAQIKTVLLNQGLRDLKLAGEAGAAGLDAAAAAMKRLTHESLVLNDQLQKAQAEGASPQTQIGILQQDIAAQRAIIAKAEEGGRQKGDISDIRKARAKIIADNAEIKSLQDGITSASKQAASDAEKAAKDAQDARDKQFQAIADSFGERQEDIENKIERAGIAGNIAKELRLNKALIASIKKERAALLERLRILKVSAEVRKKIMEAINDALEEAQQDRLRLQQEQQDNLFKRLDFRVSLAQARDDTAAELKARRARLAAITAELIKVKNSVGKNTDKWRELRLAQAEEIAAIKELEKENKEKAGAQKSLFFQFLQTQQGFAANLLGNLIPGFAAKGLVGGSGPGGGGNERGGGPTGSSGGGVIGSFGVDDMAPGTGPFMPGANLSSQAAVSSAQNRGVRPVQVDTTNHLLRMILRSLQNLNGKQTHPEARYQKSVSGGAMDTL